MPPARTVAITAELQSQGRDGSTSGMLTARAASTP